MKLKRRHFIGGALIAGAAYSVNRGLRYPPLWIEPNERASVFELNGLRASANGAIKVPNLGPTLNLRAIAPEPRLSLNLAKGEHTIRLSNVAPGARLVVNELGAKLDESIDGLARTITINVEADSAAHLRWQLPIQGGFKFAVMGDTGGGDELTWVLKRAKQLDALFLLHLGDFNYGNNEYQEAIDAFSASPIPTYISLGNHDFHDDGIIYHRFREELGPLNSVFSLAGFQFVNMDTAADFFPASGGLRGAIFRTLQADQASYSDRLIYTHRPLRDPRPGNDHIVGGVGEAEWIAQQITQLGANKLVTGHVHHSAELELDYLRQWTAGEGLGHEDIVLQRPVAQMLIGTAELGAKLKFNWADLEMPWRFHTSYTHEKKLRKDKRQRQLDWYLQTLQET